MVSDLDIWRTARLVIQQRDDPEFYAAQRADELLAAGDPDGCRVWTRIGLAIRSLRERAWATAPTRARSRPCCARGKLNIKFVNVGNASGINVAPNHPVKETPNGGKFSSAARRAV